MRLAERENREISLLMIDLDHFKRLNDEHGHAFGDQVLRDSAVALVSALRETEIVCRFGGEELVVILPDCTLERAADKAEILRLRIEELGTTHGAEISASFGVACLPHTSQSVPDLLAAADAALYKAKQNGRNQVATAPLRAFRLDRVVEGHRRGRGVPARRGGVAGAPAHPTARPARTDRQRPVWADFCCNCWRCKRPSVAAVSIWKFFSAVLRVEFALEADAVLEAVAHIGTGGIIGHRDAIGLGRAGGEHNYRDGNEEAHPGTVRIATRSRKSRSPISAAHTRCTGSRSRRTPLSRSRGHTVGGTHRAPGPSAWLTIAPLQDPDRHAGPSHRPGWAVASPMPSIVQTKAQRCERARPRQHGG